MCNKVYRLPAKEKQKQCPCDNMARLHEASIDLKFRRGCWVSCGCGCVLFLMLLDSMLLLLDSSYAPRCYNHSIHSIHSIDRLPNLPSLANLCGGNTLHIYIYIYIYI